jgi:hypothetical protein
MCRTYDKKARSNAQPILVKGCTSRGFCLKELGYTLAIGAQLRLIALDRRLAD